ncbi:MAG TPA: hypothetical protein VN901_27885 [Candidatus Acidoferrales bacterium]|nr:hypothetical protein [Candidatus Acidoferrales bacterium]
MDTKKLEQFLGQFVNDLGATLHAGMVVIGDRLGLYKALAAGPLTAAELAAITRTDECYMREWLASQAAGDYITYNPQTKKFGMTEEQALTLANETVQGICRRIRTRFGIIGRRPAHHRGIPFRRRDGLGRARGAGVSWMREILPSWLFRESDSSRPS